MASLAKQNFSTEAEDALNAQIAVELQASHKYLAMAAYFQRDTVALPGLKKMFEEMSKEEREHGEKLISYLNMRGGTVKLGAIKEVPHDFQSARNAVEIALQMEKEVNKSLLSLVAIAEQQNDSQLSDYIEGEFLKEQVESIKELADMLTMLTRVDNDGLGLYLFDRDLLHNMHK
jgi:ferritin heavy chain